MFLPIEQGFWNTLSSLSFSFSNLHLFATLHDGILLIGKITQPRHYIPTRGLDLDAFRYNIQCPFLHSYTLFVIIILGLEYTYLKIEKEGKEKIFKMHYL